MAYGLPGRNRLPLMYVLQEGKFQILYIGQPSGKMAWGPYTLESMEIRLAMVRSRSTKGAPADALVQEYGGRIAHSASFAAAGYVTEEKLLAGETAAGRGRRVLVLLDSRGRSMNSDVFATWLRRQREDGVGMLSFCIGPPDGWSDAARHRADLLLSLGPMTLPHQLAAAVLAEQIYRAFTIIEGHPYHLGHG
jgi:23S rRNA (pseudouridine1915-N3)-methyltransferase